MPAPPATSSAGSRADTSVLLEVGYRPDCPRDDRHTLAVLPHGQPAGLPLPVLAGTSGCEVWMSPRPVQGGQWSGVRYAEDGELLFLDLRVPEQREAEFEDQVAKAYAQLSAACRDLGYPHLLKVWHYFARINEGEGDAERYKRFSVGRARRLPPQGALPAATCIGFPQQGPLTLFALAGRTAGTAFENPRQVAAYRYPRQYGPVPPSFARAMLVGDRQLLVSGTAAVVGHETLHAGDAAAQMSELTANLDALLAEVESATAKRAEAQALKVYLRRPEDLPAVQDRWHARFPRVPCLFLQGEICRSDLLVEAEGFFRLR